MHSFLFVMGSLRSPAIWNLIYPIAGSDISVSGANPAKKYTKMS